MICDPKTLLPITKDQANRLFWQPMRSTEWNLEGSRNWFKIGFHSYRHSFASNLAAARVDQRIIDEFMGHQTEAMRMRYRHLFPKNRRSAIESFSLAAPSVGETPAISVPPPGQLAGRLYGRRGKLWNGETWSKRVPWSPSAVLLWM